MFSGAKIARPPITYPFEFAWISTQTTNKQHARKSVCPTEML